MFSFPLAGNSAFTAKDAVGLVHICTRAHRKTGSENTYTPPAHSAPTAFHYYWILGARWRECGWVRAHGLPTQEGSKIGGGKLDLFVANAV